MHIAFQMPNAAPVGDEGIKAATRVLRRNLALSASQETTIDFCVMEKGALSAVCSFDNASSQLLEAQNGPALVESVIRAERNGYEAVIIGCAHDPMLVAARQAVDIPVIGLTQSSVLYAHLIGASYGIVSISRAARSIIQDRIDSYGLSAKLVGISVLKSSFAEQAASFVQANENALDDFIEAARPLIHNGAEVIYPACGASSLMLRLMNGMNSYPDGITEIDGVPIVDQLSVAVKMAEMMISLKKAGSPWISRVCRYAQPGAEILEKSGYRPPELGEVWRA